MKPLTEIIATMTWFTSTLRLCRDNPLIPFPTPPAEHITRLDSGIRLLAALSESPGAQIILSELGYTTQPQ